MMSYFMTIDPPPSITREGAPIYIIQGYFDGHGGCVHQLDLPNLIKYSFQIFVSLGPKCRQEMIRYT